MEEGGGLLAPKLVGNITLTPPGCLNAGFGCRGGLVALLFGGRIFSLFSSEAVNLFQSELRGSVSKLSSVSPSLAGMFAGPGPPPVAWQDLV